MAKSKTPQQSSIEPKQWNSIEEIDIAKKKIQRRIDELINLNIPQAVTTQNGADHQTEKNISNTILEVYGEKSPEYKDHKYIRLISGSFHVGTTTNEKIDLKERGRVRVIGILNSLLAQLDEKREDIKDVPLTFTTALQQRNYSNSSAIFLVHGHDNSVLHETARFLEKLKQEIVILREQPNEGRTIIEKFVDYSEVGFAIVLLTPDDRGGTLDCPYEKQQMRARQNVIMELGYFLGKLGRERVAALYKSGVEIPSDYQGVLFTEIDSGDGWKFQLAKELKAAGYNIDMNLIT